MAWDDAAKRMAIKVIAAVESDYKYDAIYYSDPITVGIAQWYGTRAASILLEMRSHSLWGSIASSLREDLESVSASNSTFWTTRYLTRDEGRSLQPLLVANRGVQDRRLIADLEEYAAVARRLGLSPETETQAFIYWCQLYHQSPKYSRQVLTTAGDNASLDRMHAIAMNHSWYSKFRNRLNEALSVIKSGNNIIPGAGVSDYDIDGDDDDGQLSGGDLLYARDIGGDIHLKMKNGATVIFRKTGTGMYLPVGGGAGASSPSGGGTNPPGSTVPVPPRTDVGTTTPTAPSSASAEAKRKAVVKWMTDRLYKFRYSQGSGRDNPDRSGVGDCSSTVRRAYLDTVKIDIGGNTDSQCLKKSVGKIMYSNISKYGINTSRGKSTSWLLPGDLIYNSRDRVRVRHVEMYVGGTRTVGHGGPGKGPDYSTTGYHLNRPGLVIKRFIF